MTKVARLLVVGLLPVLGAHAGGGTNDLRGASEVIDALKAHYVDREKLDSKLLNDATVAGILNELGQGAKLLGGAQGATTAAPVAPPARFREPLARAEIIEPSIGYIRIADVTEETMAALDAELKRFSAGKGEGWGLALRFG